MVPMKSIISQSMRVRKRVKNTKTMLLVKMLKIGEQYHEVNKLLS